MAAKKVPYFDPLSRFDDRLLFFGAFLLGAGGIIILKQMAFYQEIVTGWPVAVMLVYTFYIWFTKRFRLREDQAGDNAYYLGLLYTLTSLAYALWLYGRNPESIDAIISNFGIALITTIVGVGLRVMMAQMRQDPVEVEREARMELSEAAARLRDELLSSVHSFTTYRQATAQSIDEAMRELQRISEEALQRNISTFAEIAGDLTKQVADTMGSHAATAQKLATASGKTIAAVEKLIERVEAIAPPTDLLERKIVPHMDKLDAIMGKMQTRSAEEEARASKLAHQVESVVREVGGLEQQLQGISGLSSGLGNVNTQLGDLVEAIQRAQQVISQVSQTTEATLKSVHGHNSVLEVELGRSRAATVEVQRTLADMAKMLVDQLNNERLMATGA